MASRQAQDQLNLSKNGNSPKDDSLHGKLHELTTAKDRNSHVKDGPDTRKAEEMKVKIRDIFPRGYYAYEDMKKKKKNQEEEVAEKSEGQYVSDDERLQQANHLEQIAGIFDELKHD